LRILVYGAGPLGSFFASKLYESGLNVSILARGRRLSDIREHGIVLENFDTGQRTITRVPVVESLGTEDSYNLVMVIMGKNYVPSVLPTLASNNATPNILFMGNNAAGPNELAETVGRERVLLGFPKLSGAIHGHVVRYLTWKRPGLTLGELDGKMSQRILWLKEMFEGAGFRVDISPNMDAWLKYHAAIILPLAGAYIRAGRSLKELSKDKQGIALMFRAMRDGFRVLKKLGFPVTPSSLKMFEWLPLWILVPSMQRILKTKRMEYAFAHGDAARNEMKVLAEEFREIIRSSSVQTPGYDELSQYIYL
jgi:2-dehydropantoate 2-reductase